MSWDSIDQALTRLRAAPPAHWQNYLGFYSSYLGGYFNEPWAMMVPLDDHGFHRGDGVFEAIRLQNRAYFDLTNHLVRLRNSAETIGMTLPMPIDKIEHVCLELARRVGKSEALLRLFVTRGPGSFSPNPKESVAPQLYAALTALRLPPESQYQSGCRAMFSSISGKDPFYSQIKSLNYLQNVLMKQECVAKGYDIAVCLDEQGRVREGATENILVVTPAREVIVPRFDYTLRGTTVSLVMKIARDLSGILDLKDVRFGDLKRSDLESATEAAFVGTTLGVLPIGSFDGRPVGGTGAGPICQALNRELLRRISEDPSVRTPF